ncbi:MAG: hypothetical protein K6F33_15695 [Bacteroidales bacterium]|nr:hypothetical protein [Bacteroidales bacterium]
MKKFLSIMMATFLFASCSCNKDSESMVQDIEVGNGNQNADNKEVVIDHTPHTSNVIYELNIGSFTTEGTLTAAKDKLPELKSLGVDIVWLMPIYPRGGGINSPYAATDFQAVNPKYGTIDDLKSYVAAAHEIGMQVWLDWVPNHTATNAKWVTSNPEYYAKDSKGNIIHPNNYGDVYQLDYSNPNLTEAMNNCLKFWIDEADIDGYRCDFISSNAIPASYWQSAIPDVKNHKSGKTITFLGEGDITDVTRLKDCGFDYDFAWGFQEGGLAKGFGKNGISANSLKNICQQLLDKSATIVPTKRMVYLTNHDQNFNYDNKTLKEVYGENRYPLTALVFTFYGMPLLYNGQEIGMNQGLDYFNDTKINWQNVDAKMQTITKNLLAIKHSSPAFDDEVKPEFLETGNSQILAYQRSNGEHSAVVVINLSESSAKASLDVSGDYQYSYISSDQKISQSAVSIPETLTLEAKGFAVYSK